MHIYSDGKINSKDEGLNLFVVLILSLELKSLLIVVGTNQPAVGITPMSKGSA